MQGHHELSVRRNGRIAIQRREFLRAALIGVLGAATLDPAVASAASSPEATRRETLLALATALSVVDGDAFTAADIDAAVAQVLLDCAESETLRARTDAAGAALSGLIDPLTASPADVVRALRQVLRDEVRKDPAELDALLAAIEALGNAKLPARYNPTSLVASLYWSTV